MSSDSDMMNIVDPEGERGSGSGTKPRADSLVPPVGTAMLCLLTLGVSIAQSIGDDGRWAQAVGVVPASVWHFPSFVRVGKGQIIPVWLTLLTYVFLHGGWWHVLPNMAGLWVFGAIAEPVMGTPRFLLAYFASGAAGALGVALVLPRSSTPVAGASLAISGILGAYMALRLTERPRPQVQRACVVALEFALVLGIAAWLAFRRIPGKPDLTCSVMYHAMPFMGAWLWVRASAELRRAATGRLRGGVGRQGL